MATGDQTIAVVGAGIGGLSCARQLEASGFRVRIFDKGRGVGGRVSVRRTERGGLFDHGAQYFTVKEAALAKQVEQWTATGVVAPWKGRIGSLNSGRWSPKYGETTRYVGVPDMTAIAKSLAVDLDVTLQRRVMTITRDSGHWHLVEEDGRDLGLFDMLIVNAPAPQAAQLLDQFPEFTEKIRLARLAPCWAVLLAFEERLDLPWDAAFVENSPLSWIARNSSKPGRPTKPDCWVLHANPEWSLQHLEDSSDVVTAKLVASFWEATGISPQSPSQVSAHRWRFALPTEPLEQRCLFDADLRLGACGDWCGGPRVEGAYLSGLALAEAVQGLVYTGKVAR